MVVRLEHASQAGRSMSNEQHVVQDIHDILESYYKVCLKTFVDSICRQSVIHYLLECNEGPLALFSPIFVSQLSAEALEEIASEAPVLKRTRAQLTKEIASLAEAVRWNGEGILQVPETLRKASLLLQEPSGSLLVQQA
jgi:hypothetical protein